MYYPPVSAGHDKQPYKHIQNRQNYNRFSVVYLWTVSPSALHHRVSRALRAAVPLQREQQGHQAVPCPISQAWLSASSSWSTARTGLWRLQIEPEKAAVNISPAFLPRGSEWQHSVFAWVRSSMQSWAMCKQIHVFATCTGCIHSTLSTKVSLLERRVSHEHTLLENKALLSFVKNAI